MSKLTEEQKQAFKRVLDLVEHCMPTPTHRGGCGPEAGCDGICMEIAGIADILRDFRKAFGIKYSDLS